MNESWPRVIAAGLLFVLAMVAMYACVVLIAARMDALPGSGSIWIEPSGYTR